MSENNNSSLLGHFDTELKLKLLGVRSSDFFGVPDLQARHPQIIFSGLALLQHYELLLDTVESRFLQILNSQLFSIILVLLTILINFKLSTLGWSSRFWCTPKKVSVDAQLVEFSSLVKISSKNNQNWRFYVSNVLCCCSRTYQTKYVVSDHSLIRASAIDLWSSVCVRAERTAFRPHAI